MEQAELKYKRIPEMSESDYIRFWSKATLTANPDICWNWNGWVRDNKKPYGRFSFKEAIFSAPRVGYFNFYKTDPKEFHVLHKCDNPKCVNPNHLFLGTNDDNIRDKVSKNRQAVYTGWNDGVVHAKKYDIYKEQFLEMKEIYEKGGVSLKSVAKKYKTSKKVLSEAIKHFGGTVEKYTVVKAEDVIKIRNRYAEGVSQKDIALEFCFNQSTVQAIVSRRNWKHI